MFLLSLALAQPPELGQIHWTRGVEAAQQRAATSHKPVLILFDEIPGCATVLGFGEGALSHPLLVEAVETLFEPVLVYNNRPEDDAVCQAWGEPRWNNPVVRIVDHRGKALAPRFDGPYDEASFALLLDGALPDSPPWLHQLALELSGLDRAKQATYAMGCFWSGQAHLGGIDGVLSTRTGWQGGSEVVQLTYDPRQIDLKRLDALAAGHATRVDDGTLRPTPKDDLYALKDTPYAKLDLSPAQASRVNAAVAAGRDPRAWLSPRQIDALR